MTITSAAVRSPRHVVALACGAALIASCAGVDRDVTIPGAAPVVAPADDAEVFTRGTAATSPVAVEAAGVDTAAAPASDLPISSPSAAATSATAPSPATPSPGSSPTGSSPVVASPPTAGVPVVVAPVVAGWPAFDLHLMTIIDAGSTAVSATVLRDGVVVHEVALGERTVASDAVEIGDRYRVASISKVITTITLLRLVEQGFVGLDDAVGARLGLRVGVNSPVDGVEQITVRHLLTHRSGIAQYENLMFRRQVESCEQAAVAGLSRGLERAPGTTFRYSNLNFCLAGLLIEDLTGLDYSEVVQRELLMPLGIDGMRLAGTFDVGDGDVEHRSDAGRNYMEVLGGAGSWIASPTDVAMIMNSIDPATPGWKSLNLPMIATMSSITVDPPAPPVAAEPILDDAGDLVDPPAPTTTVAPPPPTRGYGMGLMIFGPDSFGHTGTLEGTHAMTARTGDGITWAITVSGDYPSSSRDLAGIIAEALRYAGNP